jgi:hypothetical protein
MVGRAHGGRARLNRCNGEIARGVGAASPVSPLFGHQRVSAAISKMERQNDIYVSTLRRFVSALGGELKLVASFPDKEVVISQFD